MTVLIDANVFVAYFNKDDVHHENAKKMLKDAVSKKYGNPITSDYIFDEAVTVTLRRANKQKAIELGNSVMDSEIILLKIDSAIFKEAWNFFQEENTSDMSFTDCTNIALMNIFKITHIATFDKSFEKIKGIQIISS